MQPKQMSLYMQSLQQNGMKCLCTNVSIAKRLPVWSAEPSVVKLARLYMAKKILWKRFHLMTLKKENSRMLFYMYGGYLYWVNYKDSAGIIVFLNILFHNL